MQSKTDKVKVDLFSSNRSLEITFDGFLRLWDFVERWQRYFKSVDRDDSGCIDINELQTAISQAGKYLTSFSHILFC